MKKPIIQIGYRDNSAALKTPPTIESLENERQQSSPLQTLFNLLALGRSLKTFD